MTSGAFERVRETLSSRGSKFADTRQNHFMAQCPAHDDNNPSLSVDDRGDKVFIHCHTDVCKNEDIVEALGLGMADLFDGEPDKDSGTLVRTYAYKSSRGNVRYLVDRYWPKTFRTRPPDSNPGDKVSIKGISPILYRAEKVWPCISAGDCTVWLVDGEKDVEACEIHGLVATCPPGFGKRWRDDYTKFLRRAREVVIVVDQDTMKTDGTPGAGQQFAMDARAGLRAAGVKVRLVAPAFGKDAADHFNSGYGVDDFQVETSCSTRARGMDAATLMTHEFEPVSWAVEGILPSGLTIFAGSPKIGKSWLVLELCLAVALGGPALSCVRTSQGSVLALMREDSFRRLQSRIGLLMGGDVSAPKGLELVPHEQEWFGGEQGLADMTEWAEEVGDPRLVVVDTIAKVEPDMGEDRNRGAYAGNYSMMARYKQWADHHNCAVLMVHHDTKAGAGKPKPGEEAPDPFTRISGTRAMTGAADTLWFLDAVRGKGEGTLWVTGRDVAEQGLDLIKAGPVWRSLNLPD